MSVQGSMLLGNSPISEDTSRAVLQFTSTFRVGHIQTDVKKRIYTHIHIMHAYMHAHTHRCIHMYTQLHISSMLCLRACSGTRREIKRNSCWTPSIQVTRILPTAQKPSNLPSFIGSEGSLWHVKALWALVRLLKDRT